MKSFVKAHYKNLTPKQKCHDQEKGNGKVFHFVSCCLFKLTDDLERPHGTWLLKKLQQNIEEYDPGINI